MRVTEADGYRGVLEGSVVFQHLPPPDLDHIIERGLLVEVRKAELVLSERTRGPGLYVILEGGVEVFLSEDVPTGARRPSRVRLNTLGPGRCFGEYSLIDDHTTSASARASADGKLFFLSREEFRRIADGDARVGKLIYLNLLRFLIGRLRRKDQELDLLLFGEGVAAPDD